jgi:hypothetical protein
MLGNYQVASQLVASRVMLSSVELVSLREKSKWGIEYRNIENMYSR